MEKVIETTTKKADEVKAQAAAALEEAARRLRESGIEAKGEEVRRILQEVEERVNRLGQELGADIERVETEVRQRVEPVEGMIARHPLPAVMVAAGIGFLLGALLFKSRE